jgi:two-component system, NarL family, sensor histidine kinase UhpB
MQTFIKNIQLFNSVFETSNIPILIGKFGGTILDANQAARNLFGYTKEELLRLDRLNIFVEDAALKKLDEETKLRGYSSGMVSLKKKNGQIFNCKLSSLVFKDEKGNELICKKFEETNQIEEQEFLLNENNVFLNKILDSSSDIIAIMNKQGKRIYINKASEKILGYSVSELANFNIGKNLHPEDAKKTFDKLSTLKDVKLVENFENRVIRKDGKVIYLSWSFHFDDATEFIYTVGREITELKKKEFAIELLNAELKKVINYSQDVLEEERYKTAQIIHHDLTQSLAALKMISFTLKNKIEETNTTVHALINEQLELETKLITVGKNLFNTLHPFMLFYLGLKDSLSYYIDETQKKLSSIAIQFQSNLHEEKIDNDTTLILYRCLQECIDNIVYHSKATNVIIRLNIIDRELILEVEDDGIGFNIKEIELTKQGGLLLMRERVKSKNGKMEIIRLKKGTNIVFRIPL